MNYPPRHEQAAQPSSPPKVSQSITNETPNTNQARQEPSDSERDELISKHGEVAGTIIFTQMKDLHHCYKVIAETRSGAEECYGKLLELRGKTPEESSSASVPEIHWMLERKEEEILNLRKEINPLKYEIQDMTSMIGKLNSIREKNNMEFASIVEALRADRKEAQARSERLISRNQTLVDQGLEQVTSNVVLQNLKAENKVLIEDNEYLRRENQRKDTELDVERQQGREARATAHETALRNADLLLKVSALETDKEDLERTIDSHDWKLQLAQQERLEYEDESRESLAYSAQEIARLRKSLEQQFDETRTAKAELLMFQRLPDDEAYLQQRSLWREQEIKSLENITLLEAERTNITAKLDWAKSRIVELEHIQETYIAHEAVEAERQSVVLAELATCRAEWTRAKHRLQKLNNDSCNTVRRHDLARQKAEDENQTLISMINASKTDPRTGREYGHEYDERTLLEEIDGLQDALKRTYDFAATLNRVLMEIVDADPSHHGIAARVLRPCVQLFGTIPGFTGPPEPKEDSASLNREQEDCESDAEEKRAACSENDWKCEPDSPSLTGTEQLIEVANASEESGNATKTNHTTEVEETIAHENLVELECPDGRMNKTFQEEDTHSVLPSEETKYGRQEDVTQAALSTPSEAQQEQKEKSIQQIYNEEMF